MRGRKWGVGNGRNGRIGRDEIRAEGFTGKESMWARHQNGLNAECVVLHVSEKRRLRARGTDIAWKPREICPTSEMARVGFTVEDDGTFQGGWGVEIGRCWKLSSFCSAQIFLALGLLLGGS